MKRPATHRVNFSILLPSIALVLISLVTLYAIDVTLAKQQVIFFLLSLGGYFIFLNIDYRIFGFYSKYLYFIILIFLTIVFLIGIEARGAVRWIDIFGLRLQFSELMKPFFVIFLSYFLSTNKSSTFPKFLKTLLLLSPIFFLTLKQPDLGNATIYLLTTIFMLFAYGFPLRYFTILGLILLLPLPVFFNFLHTYQKERILSFLNLSRDPSGSSYNAIQALIAIGSGRVFGKGFGESTQSILKFLPEKHTDFIFSTIVESLGFVGAVLLIFLYAFLLYQIYKISKHTSDTFSHLVVIGFYFLLLTHVFLNIGMNIGILPIVGITLPLFSYGGSSLFTNFIILGIISSIQFEFRQRQSIEIR